jgi:hypothetical protein
MTRIGAALALTRSPILAQSSQNRKVFIFFLFLGTNVGSAKQQRPKALDLRRPNGAHREKRYTAVEQELG